MMPLTIHARNSKAAAAYGPAISQPIYENTSIRPHDMKKPVAEALCCTQHEDGPYFTVDFPLCGTYACDPTAAPVAEAELQELPRELPYFTEEEAFPETVYESAPLLAMPDMALEISNYYPATPSSRWVPPPPPPPHCLIASVSPLHRWYAHLLQHPLYASCRCVARLACPAPQDASSDVEWADMCAAWWGTLRGRMAERGLAELTPKYSWNPYNLRTNICFHKPCTADAPKSVGTRPNGAVARFPVPPPPEYTIFMQYLDLADAHTCNAMYISAAVRWWRAACKWSAALSVEQRWVCPPPATDLSPAHWGHSLDTWWSVTVRELRLTKDKFWQHRGRRSAHTLESPAATATRSHTASAAPMSCGRSRTNGLPTSTASRGPAAVRAMHDPL